MNAIWSSLNVSGMNCMIKQKASPAETTVGGLGLWIALVASLLNCLSLFIFVSGKTKLEAPQTTICNAESKWISPTIQTTQKNTISTIPTVSIMRASKEYYLISQPCHHWSCDGFDILLTSDVWPPLLVILSWPEWVWTPITQTVVSNCHHYGVHCTLYIVLLHS